MTPQQALAAVRRRGIAISVHGDKLRLSPAGSVDADLKEALLRHKPEILKLLAGPQTGADGGPLEQCAVCGCPIWWKSHGSHWRCDHCEPQTDAVVCFIFV